MMRVWLAALLLLLFAYQSMAGITGTVSQGTTITPGGSSGDIQYNNSGALGGISCSTANRVLVSGSPPSCTTVPNAALANSSVTVTAGTGITVSGSPVSLGGTVTISQTVDPQPLIYGYGYGSSGSPGS